MSSPKIQLATMSLAFYVIIVIISVSNSSSELLNIHVVRSVPKSEAKNIIRADEDSTPDPTGSLTENGGETGVGGSANSTSKDVCLTTAATSGGRRVCCLQYTWTGYVVNPLASSVDRNCSQLRENTDPNAFCVDPFVFGNVTLSRPDPQLVSEICEAESHACFCAGSSCLTYVIYENIDGQPRKNETHLCGTIKDKNTGSVVTSGCYRETREDGIHEVCACNNEPFCNHSSLITISNTLVLLCILISATAFRH